MQTRFTPEYVEYLAYKFKDGTLSDEENAEFEAWYKLQNEKQLDLSEIGIRNQQELGDRIYDNITRKLYIRPKQYIGFFQKPWLRLAVAASVIIAFCSIGYLYFTNDKGKQEILVASNDVAPGKNGATLTLADGRKIRIGEVESGKIAIQSGIEIKKTTDGQIIYQNSGPNSNKIEYNLLATSRGEQTRVQLPDGSIVFLNSASSLRYPASFASMKERKVSLTGEGYFEIAKDAKRPFKVQTNLQEVVVLGTHFNINAYNDEPNIKTTLLEGSIRLTSKGKSLTLNPGEQTMLQGSGITTRKVDTEEAVAWKNNEFFFRNDDFRTNIRKIARWYNLEVIYEPSAPDNFKLGGFLSRTRNLSAVLKLLESTGKVHFRIEGKKLFVSK